MSRDIESLREDMTNFQHRRGPLDNRVCVPLFMARNLTVVLTSDRLWRPTLNHLIP